MHSRTHRQSKENVSEKQTMKQSKEHKHKKRHGVENGFGDKAGAIPPDFASFAVRRSYDYTILTNSLQCLFQ